MKTIDFPQATCRIGVARRDITPPVGIYHRMWGAATHDRATGVHRPLLATALAISPSEPNASTLSPPRRVIVGIDHCLLWHDDMQRLRDDVCQFAGLDAAELHIAFSHTHAAGLMDRSRTALPGGELIGPYLDQLAKNIAEAALEAIDRQQDARLQYALGRCDLAVNRDQWDEAHGQFVCGVNPDGPTDDTLLLVRAVSVATGESLATVVNYACHPTTLAWQNTLVSPDYVGALRDVIERGGGGVCFFLQGASGDLGPREGFVGRVEVADRNGRQLGHAVLAALESLPPANARYTYAGPVVSGATIGTWSYTPLTSDDVRATSAWRCETWQLDLPYRDGLPSREQTNIDLARWTAAERQAIASGDATTARDCRAQVERLNRQMVRIAQLPLGETFPLSIALWQLGSGYWVFLEGEYYHHLQCELRRRFANCPIVVATVVDGWRPAYLPTRETYGHGIYQEQVAVLAPGCLEAVVESISARISAWQSPA